MTGVSPNGAEGKWPNGAGSLLAVAQIVCQDSRLGLNALMISSAVAPSKTLWQPQVHKFWSRCPEQLALIVHPIQPIPRLAM